MTDPAPTTPRHQVPVDVHLILRRTGEHGPEVLLSRRAGNVYAHGLQHLPSGHVDPDEDVVAAVIREAKEETGVIIDPDDVHAGVTVHHRSPAGSIRVGFFFEVLDWQGDPKIIETDLCSEMGWYPFTALPADMVAYCWAGLQAYRDGARIAIHFQEPGDPIEYRKESERRLTILAEATPRADGLDLLSEQLRDFAEQAVGRLAGVHDSSWNRDISQVWRLDGAHGGVWYLKVQQSDRFHQRERRAYESWVRCLGDRAPRLVATDSALRAIVITELPGRNLHGLALRRETEQEVHRQLGELIARFHSAAPAIAVPQRGPGKVEQHLELAGPYLADGDEELVRELAARCEAMPAEEEWVPIMGDLLLKNVLLTGEEPDISVGLIDFERSEFGLWLRDVARLSDAWDGRKDLADAFFAGYGITLSPADVLRLEYEAGLDAVSGVGYGAEHSDPELLERGLRTLRRLRTGTFL
ncbi:phosphotransferase [Streptomyces sp. NPDC058268]|uniref:phosphotransferase n=1 Tax=Streptomyces sp. NPDC058268 TaxID=3346413 RepID=UPI0036E07698